MSASPANKWRVLAQGNNGQVSLAVDGTEFDELVVGDWLHLERLDFRTWALIVGTDESACMLSIWRDPKSKQWRVRMTDGALS